MCIMEPNLLTPPLRENPHEEISETVEERRRANRVQTHYIAESLPKRREAGLKDQRYQHSPSSLYQLIARERTGVTNNSHVLDHVTRTYDKLKVERYMNYGAVFSIHLSCPQNLQCCCPQWL